MFRSLVFAFGFRVDSLFHSRRAAVVVTNVVATLKSTLMVLLGQTIFFCLNTTSSRVRGLWGMVIKIFTHFNFNWILNTIRLVCPHDLRHEPSSGALCNSDFSLSSFRCWLGQRLIDWFIIVGLASEASANFRQTHFTICPTKSIF